MSKKIISFVLIALVHVAFAQNSFQKHWKELLKNNRKEARLAFDGKTAKKYDKNLETLLTNEVIRNENGFITGASKNFIDKLTTFKDFEYYMYALWNKPFFFDNYLKVEFYEVNTPNIEKLSKVALNNNTIAYSLNYLNAIKDRSYNNFDGYYKNVAKIPTIKSWQICGVFENLNKSGIDINYEPESYAKDDKEFNANSNGLVKWYTPHEDFKKEPYQFFTNHAEYGYGVNYAQTFIKSNKNKRVQIRFANGSAFKAWLNGVLIYENNKDVSTDFDAYIVSVNLSKGYNRLLIKNAESNGYSYYAARISDEKGKPVEGLLYSATYKPYKQGTVSSVNPQKGTNEIEQFFIDKVKSNPNNFLDQYCLILTYLRNQKYEEAKTVLEPLLKHYKNSSLLRILQVSVYSYEQNYTTVKEVNKNISLDDPKYYYSLLRKVANYGEIERMDINALETFISDLKQATDSPIMKEIAGVMLHIRNQDLQSLRKAVDNINILAKDRVKVLGQFVPFYDRVFQDQNQTILRLEKVLEERFSPQISNMLIRYYDKKDEKEKALNQLKKTAKLFPSDNSFLSLLINKLHTYKKYEESIPYINKMMKNYPYSFKAMEYMGTALHQSGKKDEAIKYYKKSLIYNNSNSQLLKKIETITRKTNLVEAYLEKDVYKYIERERGKNTNNNYGNNILLDNVVVQLFENGSLKNRTILVYEITSEQGVENYKEFNLGLSGRYQIIKSEVVKKDKAIKPAERTGSKFVFNGLEIGDVILIEYQTTSTSSGRFYKDFVDSYQFDSESYCLKTSYTLLIPKGQSFNYKVTNGTIPYKKSSVDNYNVHTWELIKAKELPKSESYMPKAYDFSRMLHISTIKSWTNIANWYSDLVRSQAVLNAETERKFNELFPEKDITSLSEEERAKRIYYYIMNNFNYSYVSFKQSGFIPQKPAKTISSRLGDCKDFSTLFATFARKAGLDVNLVLVLTSDNGQKTLMLPSQDFNHCIVNVKLDGKNQFLELTDKNLPFKAIPNTLLNATALEIPYKSNKNKEFSIFKLKDLEGIPSEIFSKVNVKIDDKERINVLTNSTIRGDLSSYYFRILSNENYETIKKDVTSDFKNRMGNAIVLDSVFNINATKKNDYVSFDTSVYLDNKINKVGSMSIFKLPIVSNAYNQDIVNLEERKYDIIYQNYENTDVYHTEYLVEIPKGKKFVEIPEGNKYTYKKHTYEITYKKISENQLKIIIESTPDKAIVTAAEYPQFKAYVEKVLKLKDIIIGYK